MYYENDHFSPTAMNDWNVDSTQTGLRNIPANMYKKVNNYQYSKYTFSASKRAKSKTDFYASPYYNGPIYDAVTGTTIKGHFVGSKYEDLYFKVRCSDLGIGQEGATFFYHSPAEYERHNSSILNAELKEKWEKKYYNSKRELKIDSEEE